jgi:hypothetical protein
MQTEITNKLTDLYKKVNFDGINSIIENNKNILIYLVAFYIIYVITKDILSGIINMIVYASVFILIYYYFNKYKNLKKI